MKENIAIEFIVPKLPWQSSIIWKISMELTNNENKKFFAVCLQKISSSFSGLSAWLVYICCFFSNQNLCLHLSCLFTNCSSSKLRSQFSHFQDLIILIQVQYSIHLKMTNLKMFPKFKKHFAGNIFS